ncbi:MAG: hypothetical protein JW870_05375 [Candidatus Delongbacteria bacterium]|nr:hypothetical protein [Candidatus Delongbacteria bacterium]
MKGVEMYHTIKVLYRQGVSIRDIGFILKMSKTTVHKYLHIPETEISNTILKYNRDSELDKYSASRK